MGQERPIGNGRAMSASPLKATERRHPKRRDAPTGDIARLSA
jgi:hypothetical protein